MANIKRALTDIVFNYREGHGSYYDALLKIANLATKRNIVHVDSALNMLKTEYLSTMKKEIKIVTIKDKSC